MTYDVLPYDGGVAPLCLPAQIRVNADEHHLSGNRVQGRRVLELGCGVGTNLLSIAAIDPACECVGVDQSPRQIEIASQRGRTLGLTGIRWIAANASELRSHQLGAFDYIICHGVLSWVPIDVRHKLLDTIHSHLAPGGVAYISYNTRPGWGHGQGLREASQHGLRWIAEAQPSVHADLPLRAREFLDRIADTLQREQARDDLCMNTFRMSLCMRSDTPISASKTDVERISSLHLAAPLLPPPGWSWSLLQPMDLLRPDGLNLRAIFPIAKAACLLLAEAWPASLSFEELFQAAQTRMLEAGIAPHADDRLRLLGFLHAAAGSGRIDILAWPRPTSPRPADPPHAWPLASLLIEEGKTWVTTALLTNLALSSEERSALLLCDGRRTRDRLAHAMSGDPSLAPMIDDLDRRLAEWHRKGLLCSDLTI